MFISKYEKEKLQRKLEELSLLVTQATDRAKKSEEKVLQLSSKLSSVEDKQTKDRKKTVEVVKELEEIDGLSDEITTKIATCDIRLNGLEKFFAARYRHYEEMEEKFKASSKANEKTISGLEKRLDNFIDRQNPINTKVEEHLKILTTDQKMKYEKVLAVERLLEVTRGVLFGLKKDMAISKKDFNDLCKIAVTRDEPIFALAAAEVQPEKAVEKVAEEVVEKPVQKVRKTRSTKGIKLGPLIRTPEAPWGIKKDGTPRKRPGFALKKTEGNKECTIPI
jgi:chromosome segregation ATPase